MILEGFNEGATTASRDGCRRRVENGIDGEDDDGAAKVFSIPIGGI